MTRFSESVVEDAALAWLESTGWNVAHGPDIAPLPDPAGRQARRQSGGPDLVARNRPHHRLLRPDVMLLVDGLAAALQERENAADGASIRSSVQKRPAAARRAG